MHRKIWNQTRTRTAPWKVFSAVAVFALVAIIVVGASSHVMAQGPGEADGGPIGPTGVVVDADTAETGDVLAVGEERENGCDFGNQVDEIQIIGNPSWPDKAEMHVSVGPTEDCELIVAEVLWSAVTNEEQSNQDPPAPGGTDGEGGPTGDTGASSTFRSGPEYGGDLSSFADHVTNPETSRATDRENEYLLAPQASGTVEYETWAKGWWRDGVYLRITEAYVDYVYHKNGSNLSFEGSSDYECDELSTHWRTEECTSGLLPGSSSEIGRYVRGYFRTISPIDGIHPLMRSHSIKTDLKARTSGVHIRCVTSHKVPDTGVWPFTTTFECDGELQRND